MLHFSWQVSVTFDTFLELLITQSLPGSIPFAPISRIAFVPSSPRPVFRTRCFDLSRLPLSSYFSLCLLLSLSLYLFFSLSSFHEDAILSTDHAFAAYRVRRSCCESPSSATSFSLSLSSCRRWERKEKRRSRCKVPWPPRGGCTPDARWRLRVLSWLLDRYSCKINLVSSPMMLYALLAFLSLLSSSRTTLPSPSPTFFVVHRCLAKNWLRSAGTSYPHVIPHAFLSYMMISRWVLYFARHVAHYIARTFVSSILNTFSSNCLYIYRVLLFRSNDTRCSSHVSR